MNPYSGESFVGFFVILLGRIWMFLSGQAFSLHIAADEVQLLVLIGVAVSTAMLGCFLVLRKTTMLANSLSHTILLGIVIAFLITKDGVIGASQSHGYEPINIQAMLWASLFTGVATTFLTEFLTKTARLQEDASTGIVFTTLFALGVILVTLATRDLHIGVEVVMGNVDALRFDDCKLVYTVLALNIFLIVLFFKEYKITAFDPNLARTLGFSTLFFNYLLMVQVSATTVGAFRAVGVLMVLAFITGPVLTARLLTNDLKKMLFLSAAMGCSASVIGVALSRHLLSAYGLALTTGGIVVCVITVIYVAAICYRALVK